MIGNSFQDRSLSTSMGPCTNNEHLSYLHDQWWRIWMVQQCSTCRSLAVPWIYLRAPNPNQDPECANFWGPNGPDCKNQFGSHGNESKTSLKKSSVSSWALYEFPWICILDHIRIPMEQPPGGIPWNLRRGVHGVGPAKGFPQLIDHLQSHDLNATASRRVDVIYCKWGYSGIWGVP